MEHDRPRLLTVFSEDGVAMDTVRVPHAPRSNTCTGVT